MKKMRQLIGFLAFILLFIISSTGIFAQSVVKGMSANGSTGLVTSPTARIGWENTTLGVDVGYKFTGATHIPMVSVSAFGKAELGLAVDIQPAANAQGATNFLITGKYQFYGGGGDPALALAGNVQITPNETAEQVLLVLNTKGSFFDWPASTSMAIGTTFPNFFNNFPIDFSMGFELTVWPSALKDFVHLIIDFANYSYSINPTGSMAVGRGIFNAGIRIGLLTGPKFKLNIDAIGTNLLDANRGFMVGACFGMAIM